MANNPYMPPAAPVATRRERMLQGGAVITLLAVTAYALNNTTAGQLFVETAQAAAKTSTAASDNAVLIAVPAALVFAIAKAAYNNSNQIYTGAQNVYNRTTNWVAGFFQGEVQQDAQQPAHQNVPTHQGPQ